MQQKKYSGEEANQPQYKEKIRDCLLTNVPSITFFCPENIFPRSASLLSFE